jgi:hypothetical protein
LVRCRESNPNNFTRNIALVLSFELAAYITSIHPGKTPR